MKTKYLLRRILLMNLLIITSMINSFAQREFKTDKIPAGTGDIEITFIGHGSLMIKYDDKIIQVDPYSKLADYSVFPKADLVLLTHHHGDHLDIAAIDKVKTEKTQFIMTSKCRETLDKLENVTTIQNGDSEKVMGIDILAIPAYNIVHKRESGVAFHPKGEGNGYILTLGGKKVYIAGDTENIPEMKSLMDIDVAFLPMNLPYTMTPEMVADAAKALKPKILYPYHFGDTDTQKIVDLLKDENDIDLRIREMK